MSSVRSSVKRAERLRSRRDAQSEYIKRLESQVEAERVRLARVETNAAKFAATIVSPTLDDRNDLLKYETNIAVIRDRVDDLLDRLEEVRRDR